VQVKACHRSQDDLATANTWHRASDAIYAPHSTSIDMSRELPSGCLFGKQHEARSIGTESIPYTVNLRCPKYSDGNVKTAVSHINSEALDRTVHSIAHGVLRLEELSPEYGAERRRLKVMKYRGRAHRGGYHDFAIRTGGV
jgi:circadian clock protein KaiC